MSGGGLGQYDTGGGAGSQVKMRDDVYDFVVVHADAKRLNTGEVVRNPRNQKVRFSLRAEVTAGKSKGQMVTRTMDITYGASSDGIYGPFAKFIEAVTGIICGEPAQKEVGKDQLVGRTFRAMVKHENGYNNFVAWINRDEEDAESPPAAPAPAARPQPQTERAPAASPSDPAIVIDRLLDAVPLRVSQQIRALAKWAKLSPEQLASKIAFFSAGAPLAIADVPKLNDKIRAERAA